MKNKLLLFIAALTAFSAVSFSAFAEGSRELVANGGNRPYLEWYDSTTLGIKRQGTMKVFAMSGEKLLLGSSIVNASDGKDIVLITPSGEPIVFDVLKTGEGFIDSNAKEKVGPYPSSGGYTPIEYDVTQTGIYSIEFHSEAIKSNVNPPAVLVGADFLKGQGNTVAAFDATVLDASGNEKKGRGYFDYLCLNSGRNEHVEEGVLSDVHVLTADGYNYKIGLNGINPYGFILFSNNRGFLDATSNNSLYKTIVAKDNAMENLFGNIKIVIPNGQSSSTTVNHKIFLNTPASDLPASIPTTAEIPAQIEIIAFNGIEDGVAAVGTGGVFTVGLTKNTTYTIAIDVDNDGIFDGSRDVMLANAGVNGENTIYWDGLDGEGNAVAVGNYNVKATAKAGEYHFPLLDVEALPNGIKVELLNQPYEIDGFDPAAIYYDDSDYMTADGTMVKHNGKKFIENRTSDASKYKINPVSALNGINSLNGVMAFGNPDVYTDSASYYGDQKGFDFWTYFPGGEKSTTIEIRSTEKKMMVVAGSVFYDKNENGVFDVLEDGVAGVILDIKDTAGNVLAAVTTDGAGHYSDVVDVTADGKYCVEVTSKPDGYYATTPESVTVEPKANVAYIDDIGYNFAVDVSVEITADKSELKIGDTIVFRIKAKNETGIPALNAFVNAALPSYCAFVSDDSDSYDYETGEWVLGTLGANETRVFEITARVMREGTYDYPVNISAEGDEYNSAAPDNNFSQISYNVTLPTEIIIPEFTNDFAYIFGRDDAHMKAYDCMYRGEASAVIHRLMKQNDNLGGFVYDIDATPAFSDIAGRWDRSAVEYMVYRKMYDADSSASIFPDRPITRAEAFKAFCLGLCFTSDASYSNEVYANALVEKGYVHGYPDGSLGLDRLITRAEFCEIYNAIIGRTKALLVTADGAEIVPETYGFEDLSEADWYRDTMLRATSAYDDDGFVDLHKRGVRNNLDDFVG